MFLKTYNADFEEIVVTLMDQNGRPIEIEERVNLTLLINKRMTQRSLEPRTRKYVKGYRSLSFARKYKKQLLGTGLDALKTASKR